MALEMISPIRANDVNEAGFYWRATSKVGGESTARS